MISEVKPARGNLTIFYSRSDFECPCGECLPALPSVEVINVTQRLSEACGERLRIGSGLRCQAYNAKVGGPPENRHLLAYGGDAVDLVCSSSSLRYRLVSLAIKLGVKCIEINADHVHIDMRPGQPILLSEKP